jgi:hypothetical protein
MRPDERRANKDTVSPLRVEAFKIVERWARDASKEIACANIERAHKQGREPGESARSFLELLVVAA